MGFSKPDHAILAGAGFETGVEVRALMRVVLERRRPDCDSE